VLPFVKDHNTILLASHGIVCWGDTVTHAEWYVEVVDTYCKTVMIASQLRPTLNEIPPDKIADLLAIKKRLGLPDPRLASSAEAIETTPANVVEAQPSTAPARQPASYEIDDLVSRLTAEVSGFLRGTE
jgi:L-fuculose-phosphate aldolase